MESVVNKNYDSSLIVIVYNNLSSLRESIDWCIANQRYDLFYQYLCYYSKVIFENFELICLNIISFEDVMLFDFMETSNLNYWVNKKCCYEN